jgi:hypothetical protein
MKYLCWHKWKYYAKTTIGSSIIINEMWKQCTKCKKRIEIEEEQ